jgi:hypothetical protein
VLSQESDTGESEMICETSTKAHVGLPSDRREQRS